MSKRSLVQPVFIQNKHDQLLLTETLASKETLWSFPRLELSRRL